MTTSTHQIRLSQEWVITCHQLLSWCRCIRSKVSDGHVRRSEFITLMPRGMSPASPTGGLAHINHSAPTTYSYNDTTNHVNGHQRSANKLGDIGFGINEWLGFVEHWQPYQRHYANDYRTHWYSIPRKSLSTMVQHPLDTWYQMLLANITRCSSLLEWGS